jgi:hypothetical protein
MSINPLFALMANVPSRVCNSEDLKCKSSHTELPFEYPEALGGLYSDNIIIPSQVKDAYYQEVIKSGIYQATPLSEAFLEPENIEYIRQQIENNIRQYINDENIRFLLTREFAQTVVDAIRENQGLAYDVRVGLPILNGMVIHHETEIALLSERQRMRYFRWALHNDRSRVMPYGYGDKTNHVKGENLVTPSGYELNHPFKSQYRAYLRDVLQITCPPPSSRPCEIVPVPPNLKFPNP